METPEALPQDPHPCRPRLCKTLTRHDVSKSDGSGGYEAEVEGLHEGAGVQPHEEQAAQGDERHQ